MTLNILTFLHNLGPNLRRGLCIARGTHEPLKVHGKWTMRMSCVNCGWSSTGINIRKGNRL